MKILAFDTASDHACVAVQWDEAVHTRKLQGYARHSEHLLAAIAQTFAEMGLGNWQQEIDAIAFGAGPGAFTGVRLACAVAQGLGMALGKPLLALDALALIGRSAYPEGPSGRVWVAADARMGEWYHRWFEVTAGGEWQPRSEPALVSPHTARWDEIAIDPEGTEFRFAGFRLAEDWPESWPTPFETRWIDAIAPEALLAAARAAAAQEQFVAADAAQPVYVRERVALTLEEQQALRAKKREAATQSGA